MSRPPLNAPVALDTSVVVSAIFEGSAAHAWSRETCDALASNGQPVVVSNLLLVEFSQALRNLATRAHQLPADVRARYELERWDADRATRDRWLNRGTRRLRAFFTQFDPLVDVPFDIDIWHASIRLMAGHQLRSMDAVQAATAIVVGARDFVSLDPHFRRVAALRLWTPPPA